MVQNAYPLEANGRIYQVVADLTTRFSVLVAGQVCSAASGLPLQEIEVLLDQDEIFVKPLGDGFFCLAGDVDRLFPTLLITSYSLDFTVRAPRYLPVEVALSIPAGSALPLEPLAVMLESEPVRIQGRVTMALDGSPVPEARVTIEEPNLLSLRTPLHFDHVPGTIIRPCILDLAGALRALASAAAAGASVLVLDDNTGLAGGSVLRIGPAVQYEFVAIESAGPGPGEVLLRGGLLRSYPAGAVIQPVLPTADPSSSPLARAARAGTALLWLNSPLAASSIMIDDAVPAQQEYHVLDALADTAAGREGYYRLDGVTGVDMLTLRAENPADAYEHELVWKLDPLWPANTVNFRLAPP